MLALDTIDQALEVCQATFSNFFLVSELWNFIPLILLQECFKCSRNVYDTILTSFAFLRYSIFVANFEFGTKINYKKNYFELCIIFGLCSLRNYQQCCICLKDMKGRTLDFKCKKHIGCHNCVKAYYRLRQTGNLTYKFYIIQIERWIPMSFKMSKRMMWFKI